LSIGEAKRTVRAEVLAARSRLSAADRAALSGRIAGRAIELDVVAGGRTVAVYAPLGAEVDPGGIAERLRARGVRVVYPRAVPGERVLSFAACDPAALVRGAHGAGEPPAVCDAVPLEEIDCVLLPGVAFSEDGVRLGRGAGYYDATLARMPHAARVGLAFELQLRATLPREPHDAALDAIVTEARALRLRRDSR
jgi:5-formyltetrahydrofolate cyclo-ligase